MNTPTIQARMRGWSLTQTMVAIAIVAIGAGIGLRASGTAASQRMLDAGVVALQDHAARMARYELDARDYGPARCAIAIPAVEPFATRCALDANGGYLARATVARGELKGLSYTIDHRGSRRTECFDCAWAFRGAVAGWVMRDADVPPGARAK